MAVSISLAYNVDEYTIFRRFLYEDRSRSLTRHFSTVFAQNVWNQKRKEKEIIKNGSKE